MKTNNPLKVAVIGCGLIGAKRARWINEDSRTELAFAVDLDPSKAKALASGTSARPETDWKKVTDNPQVQIVVVSTPNHLLSPVACRALAAGKHVLIEKPMGRNLKEALAMQGAAKRAGKKLKVGFNHRYHPALSKTHALIKSGAIGKILNLRCVYGHGGRAGYENEWRGNPKKAGGGELTDQGIHIIDLMRWFCGEAKQVSCFLQTAFWPIKPAEDNGFALIRFKSGALGSFHSSWTQWKNKFLLEIFGEKGSLEINGLGGSYGTETLKIGKRIAAGKAPEFTEEVFEGEDLSWKSEWDDFLSGSGNADDGIGAMKILDALYRSAKSGKTIDLN